MNFIRRIRGKDEGRCGGRGIRIGETRDLSILSIGKRRVSGSSIIRVPVSNY